MVLNVSWQDYSTTGMDDENMVKIQYREEEE
jgi:hypothetical protein